MDSAQQETPKKLSDSEKIEKLKVSYSDTLSHCYKYPEMFGGTQTVEHFMADCVAMLTFLYSETGEEAELVGKFYREMCVKDYKTGSFYMSGVTTRESDWKEHKYTHQDIVEANKKLLEKCQREFNLKFERVVYEGKVQDS